MLPTIVNSFRFVRLVSMQRAVHKHEKILKLLQSTVCIAADTATTPLSLGDKVVTKINQKQPTNLILL